MWLRPRTLDSACSSSDNNNTTTIKEDETSACSPWKDVQKVVKLTLVLSTVCEQDTKWGGEPFCMQHSTHRAFCHALSTNKNNTPSRNPRLCGWATSKNRCRCSFADSSSSSFCNTIGFVMDEECSCHLSIVSPDTLSKNPLSCHWKLFLALGMDGRISTTKMMCLLNLWFFVGDPM